MTKRKSSSKPRTRSPAKRSYQPTRVQTVQGSLRKLRQRRKRLSLITSPSYHLTPKPVKKALAKTNIPNLGTIMTGVVLGSRLRRSSPCKRAKDVRRHNAMRSQAKGIKRQLPRRKHKC